MERGESLKEVGLVAGPAAVVGSPACSLTFALVGGCRRRHDQRGADLPAASRPGPVREAAQRSPAEARWGRGRRRRAWGEVRRGRGQREVGARDAGPGATEGVVIHIKGCQAKVRTESGPGRGRAKSAGSKMRRALLPRQGQGGARAATVQSPPASALDPETCRDQERRRGCWTPLGWAGAASWGRGAGWGERRERGLDI